MLTVTIYTIKIYIVPFYTDKCFGLAKDEKHLAVSGCTDTLAKPIDDCMAQSFGMTRPKNGIPL
jgi:hypothetical protein